ncbi:MAG: glycosyltransferase family 2 protein [Snowella sp.]|nr:glycosyltransferase family 2 protein [Snowella sp.]
MTEIPILSICIPAYNRPLWFRRGLQSIAELGKGYRSKVEVVITDDSDDQACQAIAEEELGGGNWRYEHHGVALGMAENWNRAIALAQGRYVVILHDDDFFTSGGVGRLVDALERLENQYSVVLFGVQVVDEKERVMKRQFFKQAQFLSPKEALICLFSDSSFVRFPAIAIQRSVFERVGFFNPGWKEPCDVEMWMRLFANYGVYCCTEVTVAYRVHNQALTMGSFNEQTVGILLGLFRELDQLNILAVSELETCKQLFFHQYILAGAWRQLRRGNFQYFHQVMALLRLPSLRDLSVPSRWLMFRLVFGMIDAIGAFLG